MITFTCSHCCHAQQVDDALAGNRARCPKCNSVSRISLSDTPPFEEMTGSGNPFDFSSGWVSSSTTDYGIRSARRKGWLLVIAGTAVGFVALVAAGIVVWLAVTSIGEKRKQQTASIADFTGRWADTAKNCFTFDANGKGTGYFHIPVKARIYFNGAAAFWTGEVQIKQRGNRFYTTVAKEPLSKIGPVRLSLQIDRANRQIEITHLQSGERWLIRKCTAKSDEDNMRGFLKAYSITTPIYFFSDNP